jgi:hypothetical protein
MEITFMRERVARLLTRSDVRDEHGQQEYEVHGTGIRNLKISSNLTRAQGDDSTQTMAAVEDDLDGWLSKGLHQDAIESRLVRDVKDGMNSAYEYWNSELGTNHRPTSDEIALAEMHGRMRAEIPLGRLRVHMLYSLRKWVARLRSSGLSEKEIVLESRKFFASPREVLSLVHKYARLYSYEAYNDGLIFGHTNLGADSKKWITVGDDRVDAVCIKNAAAGTISIKRKFPSGHQFSPAHTGCRCTILYSGVTRRSLYWASKS